MNNDTITLHQASIKQQGGVVVLDIGKFQAMQKALDEYRVKERLVRNVKKFKALADWGEDFAETRHITEAQVLADD